MEAKRSKSRVLHVLRSVMLAGAGAVVWMALSSTAANADSGNTNHTLLGGAGSAVSNVVQNAAAGLSGTLGNAVSGSAGSASAADSVPAPVVHLPAVVPQLARSVDQLVASTPVVSAVLPEGTVGAVTARVVSPAASAVDGIGSSVGSLVGRVVTPALGAVGPAVQALPVILPVTISGIPATTPAVDLLGDLEASGTPSGQSSVLGSVAGGLPPVAVKAAAPLFVLGGHEGLPVLAGAPWNQASWNSGASGPSASNAAFPRGAPGGSDTVSGSAALSSNPSGAAAAWLQGTNLFYPLAGTLVSTAAAGSVPAPVSFDPGSSPD
ncbi:hypothetical protein [Arthrobacter sp. B2a2-09]|uniref:hypothetical protein n=1 Tax=Arthrobacter sp. B2a2-09 TaxID=2952822 RepID=UPI0022CDB000|nr:hypothetical protein [Arthrobacter sp. B2a2-09]MCZ9881275.1 hypothetical protein [Arthrobacter sp. B2a2-09]